jgi:hypothetical protein
MVSYTVTPRIKNDWKLCPISWWTSTSYLLLLYSVLAKVSTFLHLDLAVSWFGFIYLGGDWAVAGSSVHGYLHRSFLEIERAGRISTSLCFSGWDIFYESQLRSGVQGVTMLFMSWAEFFEMVLLSELPAVPHIPYGPWLIPQAHWILGLPVLSFSGCDGDDEKAWNVTCRSGSSSALLIMSCQFCRLVPKRSPLQLLLCAYHYYPFIMVLFLFLPKTHQRRGAITTHLGEPGSGQGVIFYCVSLAWDW